MFRLNMLRKVALTIVFAAAIVSVSLMMYNGRHNDSTGMMLLFLLWVVSPFMGLLLINLTSSQWSDQARGIIYYLMLIISIGVLPAYCGLFSIPGTNSAFVFIFMPLVSWLLISIVVPLAASWSRRLSGNNTNRGGSQTGPS